MSPSGQAGKSGLIATLPEMLSLPGNAIHLEHMELIGRRSPVNS